MPSNKYNIMTVEREYEKILTRGVITIYENHKYYLVRDKNSESDDIYPKKDWTLREVLKETGISIPEE
jgi:DNA-binding transcriptional regulator YhcF (GntR family)